MAVSRSLVISPHFKLIFVSVLGLTVLSLVGSGLLTILTSGVKQNDVTDMEKRLFDICAFGWQSGFGAILGLIGGKLSK
jgi:hypothetical protein